LGRDIKQLDWMSTPVRLEALAKLSAVRNKIGFPNKWRDYGALAIRAGDALGNATRASEFEHNRWLKKIDTPVDPNEWYMTPPTVNAYYSASENNINFPAGILQSPFFDVDADVASNFGAIGAVIGHELTHGFDDQGRQFDAKGNLRDWWTPDDATRFVERAQCFENQYGKYSVAGDLMVNGKLTLGENIADNGGLRLALMALTDLLAGQATPPVANLPEQRFFLGWAQAWCENITPEAARLSAQADSHSPPRYRVNGAVSNMPEFALAFGCKAGAPMVRAEQCRVW
jgi:endothelin-converting enzyme/putative endopeptidase